jgi:hypothetical protein
VKQTSLFRKEVSAPATAYECLECERLARRIWVEREKGFPRFVQQTWEQGTQMARDTTLVEAARRLGLLQNDAPNQSETI